MILLNLFVVSNLKIRLSLIFWLWDWEVRVKVGLTTILKKLLKLSKPSTVYSKNYGESEVEAGCGDRNEFAIRRKCLGTCWVAWERKACWFQMGHQVVRTESQRTVDNLDLQNRLKFLITPPFELEEDVYMWKPEGFLLKGQSLLVLSQAVSMMLEMDPGWLFEAA